MKFLSRNLSDVAFILDLGFLVRAIYQPTTGKNHGNAQSVAHWRNENDARDQNQMKNYGSTDQP